MSKYIEFYKFSLPLVLTVNRCRIFHIFTYQGFYILTDAIYTRKYNTAKLIKIKWMGLINLSDWIQWQRIHIPNRERSYRWQSKFMHANCYQLLKHYQKIIQRFETYNFFTWYNVKKLWNNKSEVYFVYRILPLQETTSRGKIP